MSTRQFHTKLIHILRGGAIVISTTFLLLTNTMQVAALTNNPTATGKISFTFDDGLSTALTNAAPTLAKYGFSGTEYVITGCVGTTGTCAADPTTSYMTWDQIQTLKSTYGWEIGSHSATHPQLATDGLTSAQVDKELADSKTALAAHGFDATAFASPYGDYSPTTLALISKYYTSHRGFWDIGQNTWPYNDSLVYVQQVQGGVRVNTVKKYIDQAKKNKTWLVLVFHNIKDKASTSPDDYEYSTSNLSQIAAYAKTVGLPASKMSENLVTSDTDLIPNSTFDQGITNGWTTDATTQVKLNTESKGSYPSPTNSIELTATTKNVHLFSPKVAVNASTTYLYKSFLNVERLSSGEVGYYIDEYDSNGTWTSGQYKKAERSVFVDTMNFTYKPTSTKVAKASLQIIVSANSNIKAYVDNVQMFPLN